MLTISLFYSCKKIPTPDPSVKAVFGHWRVVSTSGGWIGGPIWPTDKEICIEFLESGKYKKHEKGKLTKTEKFKFTSDNNNKYIIDYEKSGIPDQSFSISNDTLILIDRYISEGSVYVFVKK